MKEMFGDLNTASPAEEYDEQDEHDEQDPFDSATAGKSSSTVFVHEVDAGTKSVTRKVVGSRMHAIETTFDVFTEGNETLGAWARWSTEPTVQLPSEVLTVGTVMQWRSSAREKAPTWESHTTTGDRVWVARRKDRSGIVVMLQGDSKQVCQCTTTKFRDEPDEEQRWLKAEMVVVAVAKAYCCNEVDLDELH